MSDSKSPNDDSADELFDHDYMTDSDSEFLAELDRVLCSDSETASPENPLAEDTGEAFDLAELTDDIADKESQPIDLEDDLYIPSGAQDAAPPAPLDEPLAAVSRAPRDDALNPLEPESVPEDTPASELDWRLSDDEFTDSTFEQTEEIEEMELALEDAAALEDTPTDMEPASDSPAPREAEHPDLDATLAIAGVAGAAMAATAAAGTRSDTATHADPPAADSPPPPPSTAAPEAPEAPPEPMTAAPPRRDSSAAWAGLTGLMALLALAMGGAALWQTNSPGGLPAQRAGAPTASPVTLLPAPETARLDTLEDRLTGQIAELQADIESVKAGLKIRQVGRVPTQPAVNLEAVEGDIEKLEAQLGSVQQALQTLLGQARQFDTQLTRNQQRIEAGEQKLEAVQRQLAAKPPVVVAKAGKQAEQPAPSAPRAQRPAAAKTTGWSVNLLSFRRMERAEKQLQALRSMAISAKIKTVQSKGKTWHRLIVDGFDSFAAAKAYAEKVRGKPDLASAWVGRN